MRLINPWRPKRVISLLIARNRVDPARRTFKVVKQGCGRFGWTCLRCWHSLYDQLADKACEARFPFFYALNNWRTAARDQEARTAQLRLRTTTWSDSKGAILSNSTGSPGVEIIKGPFIPSFWYGLLGVMTTLVARGSMWSAWRIAQILPLMERDCSSNRLCAT
jgi:hypothetical protein